MALEANRLLDRLLADGERMGARDLLIAATARTTGDELVVADGGFETDLVSELMDVTNVPRDAWTPRPPGTMALLSAHAKVTGVLDHPTSVPGFDGRAAGREHRDQLVISVESADAVSVL